MLPVAVIPVSATSVWHQNAAQMMTVRLDSTVIMVCVLVNVLKALTVHMVTVLHSVMFLLTSSASIVILIIICVIKDVTLTQTAPLTTLCAAPPMSVAALTPQTVREALEVSVMCQTTQSVHIVTQLMLNASQDVMKTLTVLLISPPVT